MKSVFFIAGMCCPTEQNIIRNRLRSFSGVERLDFNMMEREVAVSHELEDDGDIFAALSSLGLGAQRKAPASEATSAGVEASSPPVPQVPKVLLGISGVAALGAELLAHASGNEKSWPVIALALLSITAGGRDTIRKAWVSLRTWTLNINFLMALAVVGAVCIGQWPEAAMVTFLFGVAEMVESFSLDRARNAIRALLEVVPETATVRSDDGVMREWREVRAGEVRVGQTVRVKPGQRIPLDGTVTAGASSVDQAPITGESIPVEKQTGDAVFAGSINGRGSFEFSVTASRGNTTLARIIRAVQEAQSQRAPTQRFIDTFARYYTPAVVLGALLVAVVPPLFFAQEAGVWSYRALVLLVIACPCALVISTPVTVVSGLAAAARRGILIKGGAYLEAGRNLRVVALDKTGTLTYGKPVVTDIVPLHGERENALHLAASLDALSEHPIASAIVAAWTDDGRDASPSAPVCTSGCCSPNAAALTHDGLIRLDALLERNASARALWPVTEFESLTGRGVRGVINGALYFVGNRRLAQENGVCDERVEAELLRLEKEGKTAVVVSDKHRVLAVVGVADTPRETSAQAVRELHELGVRTVMLSGDNQTTAGAIAQEVGIGEARGELLPEDKLAVMNELLLQGGAVGMVGDGINDAPALARASIGFAMGAAGSGTAIETADVALMRDDLRLLPGFIRLSRATGKILGQNIALALALKIVFFALALTGHATLWMAVFADMGGSLLVTFNGLRLLRFRV